MLFNSYIYIFAFLPIVVVIYSLLQKTFKGKLAINFLVIASYVFYAYWNPAYLPLILISIYFNYFLGSLLFKKKAKSLLVSGILLNLAPLIYFKYTDFLIENINFLFNSNIEPLGLELPLAISFFTFQQIAYLVDSYKKITHEYNMSSYSLFVTFFPQLIAGPIVHHKEMLPQFFEKKNIGINYDNIKKGIIIFSIGLFKKCYIADTLSPFVKNGFDSNVILNSAEAWATSLAYSFQLYFDFSGYSDMAIGSALIFNIIIPDNFNSPYKSRNIQQFWRRWHITLGRWLKDYIYIPLGGNRKNYLSTQINLLITFVVGGIWHGAGWNFLIWGVMHGGALVFLNILKTWNLKLPKLFSIAITFLYAHLAWVFFRATTFDRASEILVSLFSNSAFDSTKPILHNVLLESSSATLLNTLALAFLLSFFAPNSMELTNKIKDKSYNFLFASILFVIGVLYISRESDFLYFQF